MALRHRDLVNPVADRENLNAKPTKAQLTKHIPPLRRRPALDELSNKLNNLPKPAANKQEPVKDHKPAPKAVPPKKENEPPVKAYSTVQLDNIIEHDTSNDPQMVSEYLGDIFTYLRELETKYPIREKFLEGHKSTPRMRSILVNWLVQVHQNFSLYLETLHMCVSLIDRYLQDNPNVGRESLQLVGASALLVACKYEEVYLPDLKDFVYICDNTFSSAEILKMEKSILVALDCCLGKPLSIHFLRRFNKVANVRLEQHNLSKYILELALLDHNMSHVKPSLQAAAACCLAVAVLSTASCPSKVWTPELAHHSTWKYRDIKPIVVKFAEMLMFADTSKNKSVQKKYADAKYNKVSTNPKLKGLLVKKLAETSPKP